MTVDSDVSEEEVMRRISGLPEDKAKSVICALVGHSRIKETFFGYWSCARCGDQVGDSLAGSYSGKNDVLLGHDCEVCRSNAAKLTWKDTLMAPDPFAKKDEDAA